MVGAVLVDETDEIMLITSAGVLVRTEVEQIREMGRATQGVTLINCDEGDLLTGVKRVVESDLAESDDEEDRNTAIVDNGVDEINEDDQNDIQLSDDDRPADER